MTTPKQVAARKAYWARMAPEERSARMRALAKKKQSQMTFKQKYDHAMKMVRARSLKHPIIPSTDPLVRLS